jgi:hypothetical protein
MRVAMLLICAACGDGFSGAGTPEQVIAGASIGQRVEVTGTVHTVTFDSTQDAARRAQLALHRDQGAWALAQEDERLRGTVHAYEDVGAKYPRTEDHYILIRTVKPRGIAQDEPGFVAGDLLPAWGLGVHVTAIDPAAPLPEIGAVIKVTGTFQRITWNAREVQVPIVEDPVIAIVSEPARLAGPGESCGLDQECNAHLICDRTSRTCGLPPREIHWADPWRDVNGACDTDADCPLGQVCDQAHAMSTTGNYAVYYFVSADAGRHLCVLAPGATLASQCPRIYTTRDLAGGRFVTGKEVCVRGRLLSPVPAEDLDTHDQLRVDEPIPYPTDDIAYHMFGATTENGPIYKDPTLPGGGVQDPAADQEVVAVGTYRYDPDHGWYEIHPVKAYLAPP